MKILLVIDQFYAANNGATISARRFYDVLKRHGNEVRVLAVGSGSEKDGYAVKELKIPFFNNLIHDQGMTLAKTEKKILARAIQWADVVHFMQPFPISQNGKKIADQLGVPSTAAFHVQPENITYSIGLGCCGWANRLVYRYFRKSFFDRFTHVHCPSHFIEGELKRAGYKAQLHVISNGIDPDFTYRKLPKTEALQGKFVVLMVGRLSNEKRQDVLIRAVAQSKYKDRIQLMLAGQGPKEESLKKLGRICPNPPIIGFYHKQGLMDLIAMSDLYVHAADAEIEAMSCMEAFASGLVPVIANSPKSATPQFALDERSLFRAGDSSDLAKKMDYWIEHEQERKEMERAYSNLGKKYDLDHCVRQAEDMFRQAIEENAARDKVC